MDIIIDQTGHGWMYSAELRRWLMVRCSCDVTSPTCPMPAYKKRGTVQGRRRFGTANDRLRFEEKVMQFG